MPEKTVTAFITKYGSDGLLAAIGDRTTGYIVRGNDYVSIEDLRKNLTYLNGEPHWRI